VFGSGVKDLAHPHAPESVDVGFADIHEVDHLTEAHIADDVSGEARSWRDQPAIRPNWLATWMTAPSALAAPG
jgi:hypothetical protein